MQLPLVVVQLVLVSSTWLMYMCGGGSVNIVLGTFTPAGALGEESGSWFQIVPNVGCTFQVYMKLFRSHGCS